MRFFGPTARMTARVEFPETRRTIELYERLAVRLELAGCVVAEVALAIYRRGEHGQGSNSA
jgi:hypothetical protein